MRKIQTCFAIYSKGIKLVCNGCDVIGRTKIKLPDKDLYKYKIKL